MITLDYEEGMIYIGVNSCKDVIGLDKRLSIVKGVVWHIDRYLVPVKQLAKLRSAVYGFKDDFKQTNSFKRLILLEKAGKLGVETKDLQMSLLEIDASITIEVGPNKCRLTGEGIPDDSLDTNLKYFLKSAVNTQRFKTHKWDGYIHMYDQKHKTFPTGLLSRVKVILESRDLKFDVRGCECLATPTREYDWRFTDHMTPMPDQVECINAINAHPQCTIKCPTGFGKTSLIASKTIADFGVPSVYVANQNLLLYQAMEEFEANIVGAGNIGIIGGGECNIQPITVASIQTVAQAFKVRPIDETMAEHLATSMVEAIKMEMAAIDVLMKGGQYKNKTQCAAVVAETLGFANYLRIEHERIVKYANRKSIPKVDREVGKWYQAKLERMIKDCKSYVKVYNMIMKLKARVDNYRDVREFMTQTVKYIFFDECQSLGTDIWRYVTQQTDAPIRIAASATPKREDGADLEIEAASGPKVYEVSAGELIDLGRLAEIKVEFVPFDHELYNDNGGVTIHEAEDEYIVRNEQRNQLGINLLRSLLDEGRFTIVLTKRIEHGELLLQMCLEQGISDVRHVHGSTNRDIKKAALSEFGSGDYRVLIASTILDVGINLPRASGLLLMGAGSSEIRGPQRLGRIIRLFKLDPGKIARAYDILDQNVAFFERQAWKRYRNYCSEFERKRISIRGGKKRKSVRDVEKEDAYLDDEGPGYGQAPTVVTGDFEDEFQVMAEGFAGLFH